MKSNWKVFCVVVLIVCIGCDGNNQKMIHENPTSKDGTLVDLILATPVICSALCSVLYTVTVETWLVTEEQRKDVLRQKDDFHLCVSDCNLQPKYHFPCKRETLECVLQERMDKGWDLNKPIPGLELDLNKPIPGWYETVTYPVVHAVKSERYENALFFLKAGAAYQPDTVPGGELQRTIFEQEQRRKEVNDIRKQRDGVARPELHTDVHLQQVMNWLENRGVKFDEPVPKENSIKIPPPLKKPAKNPAAKKEISCRFFRLQPQSV